MSVPLCSYPFRC